MLNSLYIRNFALIEELRLELEPGFNILTGETGAGKSLLLGAIGLILGKRLDSSFIFNQDHKCIVEAEFLSLPASTLEVLRSFDEFDVENESLLLRREARANGTSRAFINDTPVSLSVMKKATSLLLDLHGQHENQQLLAKDQQLRLLDEFAGTQALQKEFKALLNKGEALHAEIGELREQEKAAKQQLDYYQFQLQELEAARLDPEKDESLEEELIALENSEEIRETLGQTSEVLYEGDESIYSQLSEVLSQLKGVASYHSGIQSVFDSLEQLKFALKDGSTELSDILEGIDLDPGQLAELQGRVDLLNRLKVKFGTNTVAELAEIEAGFARKVLDFSSLEDRIAEIQLDLDKADKELLRVGLKLDAERRKASGPLSKEVNRLLGRVGLENAFFEININWSSATEGRLLHDGQNLKPLSNGLNRVEFSIRTNPGMPMGPLAGVASGGEVSRVMLAIKAALAKKASLSVLIFDEIDTGISGETANKVAQVMRELSKVSQIIAITHLPQIAGAGQGHYLIYKQSQRDKTATHVRPLSGEERVLELAKMLSGSTPSESAIENARELIKG